MVRTFMSSLETKPKNLIISQIKYRLLLTFTKLLDLKQVRMTYPNSFIKDRSLSFGKKMSHSKKMKTLKSL